MRKLLNLFKHWQPLKVSHQSRLFGQHLTKRQAQAFKVLSILIVATSLAYIIAGRSSQFLASGEILNQAFVTWDGGSASSNLVRTEVIDGDPPSAQCADTQDNDSDGKIDYPADPGCSNAQDNDETDGNTPPPPPAKQCGDGIDNDSDSKTDFPADPGCTNADDDDETDPPVQPQCNDGTDNDSDGKIDLTDPGCSSANDNNEGDDPPVQQAKACIELTLEHQPPRNLNTYWRVINKTTGTEIGGIKLTYNYQSKIIETTDATFVGRLQTGTTYVVAVKIDSHLIKRFDWTFINSVCPRSPRIIYGDLSGVDGNGIIGNQNQVTRTSAATAISNYVRGEISRPLAATVISRYVLGIRGD